MLPLPVVSLSSETNEFKRMKILLLAVQMSLGTLSYSEEPCEAKERRHYHIINATVKIPVTYCFFNVGSDFKCEDYHNATFISNNQATTTHCIQQRKPYLSYAKRFYSNIEQDPVVPCQSTAALNLLKSVIVLPGNIQYHFCTGIHAEDGLLVTWNSNAYENLGYARTYSGSFDVYVAKASTRAYIRTEHCSLELKGTVTFCNLKMWRTNYDDIYVVSTFNGSQKQPQKPITYQSSFDDECKITKKEATKTWYVYRYLTDVTIFYCSDSCKADEHTTNANKSLLNQCKNFCEYCKLCKKILKIDLRHYTVQGLPPDCKYSNGECRSSKAFWHVADICANVEKLEGNYQQHCKGMKCVIRNSNSTEFILSEETDLCGGSVWFTDKDGIIASEKEFQFKSATPLVVSEKIVSKAGQLDTLAVVVLEQSDDLNDLKAFVYYLLFFVMVCILGYIFSVIVNFFTLRNVGKRRALKNSLYLMNCFSQSLTNRYVFLESSDIEKSEPVIMSKLKESELYESVDDK